MLTDQHPSIITMATAAQVLATPELVEMILLECTVAECTCARRISLFWSDALGELRRPEFVPPHGNFTVFKSSTIMLDKHSFDKLSDGSWEQLPIIQRRSGWALSYTLDLWSQHQPSAHCVNSLGKLRKAMQESHNEGIPTMMVTIDGFVEEGSEEVKAARAKVTIAAAEADDH